MPTSVWGVVKGGRIEPSTPLPEGARVEIRLADQLDLPADLQAEFEAWDHASADALELVERLAREDRPDEAR